MAKKTKSRTPKEISELKRELGKFKKMNVEAEKHMDAILKLNNCFLELGSDYEANINIIVHAAGRILNGIAMAYNSLDKNINLLSTKAIWQEPEGYIWEDNPEGHICYDLIKRGKKTPLIIEDLKGTEYEKTDPNVKKYKLRSYIGFPVSLGGEVIGSLCACDVKKRKFTDLDILVGSMLAKAIGREEGRYRTNQALRESESKFKAIFNNPGGAIFIANIKNGRIMDCNMEAEKLLGLPRNKIVGMHQSELHPEGEAEKYKAKFDFHVKKGHIVDFEGEVIHKDGRRIPVIICAQTLKLDNKDLILGFFVDVSKIRKIKEEAEKNLTRLHKAYDKLEACYGDQVAKKEEILKLREENRKLKKRIKTSPKKGSHSRVRSS